MMYAYASTKRYAPQLTNYVSHRFCRFRHNRRSNRTGTGCAGSWPSQRPSANNGAMSCRPISRTCRRCSTVGNVNCARRTNRNEPWSESSRTRMAGCSRTSERFVLIINNDIVCNTYHTIVPSQNSRVMSII